MDVARLEEFNHWWHSHAVDGKLALPFKRDAYVEAKRRMPKRFILAVVGLRRVGKSTILYQLIGELITRGVPAESILFFSFDDRQASVADVMTSYAEFQKKDFRRDPVYVFLDEIQKCDGWEDQLKTYYDLYPTLKFVISGSESLFIREKNKETLAGRISELFVEPFSFREYLRLPALGENDWKYESKVRPFFESFVLKGGFPETFDLDDVRDFKEYVRALVVDRIVYKDIPMAHGIADPHFLSQLLEYICMNPGAYLDFQSLSRQFGKDRRVVKDYVRYLEETFLIRVLGNYRKGSSGLMKLKRAYPADTALISLFRSGADPSFFGRMVETVVINHAKAERFWKNGSEIDLVSRLGVPIEVKYQEKIHRQDAAPVFDFMDKFDCPRGLIVTKKDEGEIVNGKSIVMLVPAWKWLLEPGVAGT